MRRLQKKIFKKIIDFEKRQIFFFLIKTIFIFFATISLLFFVLKKIIEILNTFQSWAVFEIFFENFEVLKKYGKEALSTLYFEFPKIWLLLFLAAVIIFLRWAKDNFLKVRRIKTKIRSLKRILQKDL